MTDWDAPRSYAAAQLTRAREPYAHQRDRQLFNKQPRAAQANTSQPNQKAPIAGWGMSTEAYWQNVFTDYLKRRREGQ